MEYSSVYEMRADQQDYFNLFFYDIRKNNPKQDDAVHFHQSLEFVYVAEGSFPVHIQGVSYLLKPGEIAYIQSGQIHYFTTLGDAKVFVLVVGLEYLNDPLYDGRCLLPNTITLSDAQAEKMSKLLYCMFDIWEFGNVPLGKGIFNAFIGLLSEYCCDEPYPNDSKFPIFEILKYIDGHFSEHITLKGLAAHFNYADTYFSTCFKAHLNMSLREYINRIRIRHANRLIEQGMTKNQVAAACGYTSNNTFFRAYKKYRNKYIKEIEETIGVISDGKHAKDQSGSES